MGPIMLPWAIPMGLYFISELYICPPFVTDTLYCLSERYDLNHFKELPLIPYISSFFKSRSLSKQSYAFVKSKKTPSAISPFSILFTITCRN